MKFNIGTKAIKPHYRNEYVVECVATHGDDDGREIIEIGGFKKDCDEDLLTQFIELCERLEEVENPDDYDEVEEYETWFGYESLEEDVPKFDRIAEIRTEWISDLTSDGIHMASFDGFEVVYYDENGDKFEVFIK